jgi:aspartate/methionine/tyrosine aminotransferase
MGAIRKEIEDLELSGISKVALGALGDPEVIPLWFGESDIVTPAFIRDAAKAALDSGQTFYSYSRGTPALRAGLKTYLDRLYGIDLHPDRITVAGSTMLSVVVAAECLLDRDDEIVLLGPYWPNIRVAARLMGARSVDVRLRAGERRWELDLGEVARAITPRTKAVYVNTPSNPTGWIMSAEEGSALLDLCRHNGLGLIADEVYHRNVFHGRDPAPSFLELAGPEEPVFVLNGFSKAWAMTGWRLGWMVAPQHLVEPMAVLAECNNTGATVFAQAGGLAALEQGEEFVHSFVARTRINRDLVMELIGSHPKVTLPEPEGAFYAFPRIEGLTDSLAFAREVLQRCKVGIAAGYTFGAGNEGHVRLCFAIRTERLRLALERLRGLLDEL